MNLINEEYYNVIRRASNDRKLAIFVGAGVSMNSGLPSWSDLITKLKISLDIETDDNLKIAEHYYNQYGKHTYYNKIKECVQDDKLPNDIHDLILELKPQHIITTNWDNLLEKAINKQSKLYFPVVTDQQLGLSPTHQLLIKMHGDLENRNVVFKESDYHSYSDNFPLIENFIKSIFSTHIVLFIGYSISDYNLNMILSWIKNRTSDAPPAYTIITNDKISPFEVMYLKNKNVYPIIQTTQGKSDKNSHKEKLIYILKDILLKNNKNNDVLTILENVLYNIKKWQSVHPHFLVRIIKDEFNITETNKIYFDSAFATFKYNASEEEKRYTQDKFELIRKKIEEILQYIPDTELHVHCSQSEPIKIINPKKYNFRNNYTTFNFQEIYKDIDNEIINHNSDNLDKEYHKAFNYYYLHEIPKTQKYFLSLTNAYYNQSSFVKSYLSAFNKKMSCNVSVSLSNKDFKKMVKEIFPQEQLSSSDKISEILEKFPNNIWGVQKVILQELDVNNAFFLKQFKNIMKLKLKIDDEVDKIKIGTLVFSNTLNEMYEMIKNIIIFLLDNKITLQFSSDYKEMCHIAFTSILKRYVYEKGTKEKPIDINIDNIMLYLAIGSFDNSDKIYNFLTEILPTEKHLVISSETFDYASAVLENCQDTFSSNQSEHLKEYCTKIYANTIIILSFIKHDPNDIGIIIDKLSRTLDKNNTKIYRQLFKAINMFLVTQFNRFDTSIEVKKLKSLIYKILETDIRFYYISQQGSLLCNLCNMLHRNQQDSDYQFDNDEEISKFLKRVESFDFNEQFTISKYFLQTIFYITTGQLKEDTKKLLITIFNESKKQKNFNNDYVVLGLDLLILGIIKKDDFSFIFNKLKENIQKDLDQKQTTSIYTTIKAQLEKISTDKDKIDEKEFDDVFKNVSELADKIRSIFV